MLRPSTMMSGKKSPLKRIREPSERIGELAEVALAAITSYKKQKEVSDFINFLLDALERNSGWLNNTVGRQSHFRCALLVGAGPNRFQVQEIIYPSGDNEIKLEVELKESEDHDKIAIAALLKMTNVDIDNMLRYLKNNLFENPTLKQDLLAGKALGISFAVLRPITDKQYRVMERIVVGSSMKCVVSKKRKDEKLFQAPPFKKFRKILT